MNTKSTINKRFLKVFEELEKRGVIKTRASAARVLGIEPQRMNEILKGRLNVSTAVLSNLFMRYNVDPDYIFLDELPMFRASQKELKITRKHTEPMMFAAEPQSSYGKKKQEVRIHVKRVNEKNKEVIEYISLSELATELGLKNIEAKLDVLLRQSAAGNKRKKNK